MESRVKSGKKYFELWVVIAILLMCSAPLAGAEKTGVLVIAHGDRHDGWNQGVRQAIAPLQERYVLELAFLFPVPSESLQEGLDRLEARGVERILVIPLLISSYSEHFEELEYILGLRETVLHATDWGYKRVDVKGRIRLGRGIDSNPTVTKILERRARKLSVDPQHEVLVLIGHGPNGDDYNQHWIRHMSKMGKAIQQRLGFRETYALTLRDDAPAEIREAATRALRVAVEEESKDGNVLVLPLLVSYGELQAGIKERLNGLTYLIADEGLVADPLITQWVEEELQRLSAREPVPGR